MVTVIKTFKELEQADAYDAIFDTTVVFNKHTGQSELQADWKDIIAKADFRSDFYYNVLKNTMKSFKSKKAKMDFINTVMRQIGQDMDVYFGGKIGLRNEDHVKKFVDALFLVSNVGDYEKWDKALDSDAQVIANLIDPYNGKKFNFGSMRFDAGNPLHTKIAEAALKLEEQGNELFKGFTARWNADTMTSKQKAEAAKKAGKTKTDNIMVGLDDMSVEDLYKEYRARSSKMDDGQKLIVIRQLIKSAPVNAEWYTKIYKELPKMDKSWRGKDTYDVIDAFDEKFDKFAKEAKQNADDLEKAQKTAESELENTSKAYQDTRKKYKQLEDKKQIASQFQEDLNRIMRELQTVVNECIDKEKKYYDAILEEMQEKMRSLYNGAAGEHIKIEGHPWGIFGGNQEKKQRYEKVSRMVDKYNSLADNVPEAFSDEDSIELDNLDRKSSRLKRDYDDKDSHLSVTKDRARDAKKLAEEVDTVNNTVAKAKKVRTEVVDNARKKVKSMGESGYAKWSKDAKAIAEQKTIKDMAAKLKYSNPNLSEAELEALAVQVLASKQANKR